MFLTLCSETDTQVCIYFLATFLGSVLSVIFFAKLNICVRYISQCKYWHL